MRVTSTRLGLVAVRCAAGLALWCAATAPAHAQAVALEPSAATRCLTPVAEQRGVPTYPFNAWKGGAKGRVLVELNFTTPDQRPAVKVLESEGGVEFVDAVREHVAAYRVPCLDPAAGVPAQLRLEYVFRPDERQVYGSAPSDPGDERRSAQLKCVAHRSGRKIPDYPTAALQGELQGRVLVRLHFTAADRAPEAQVFARPSSRILAEEVEHFVQGLRMPCFEGPEPVGATYTYVFRLQDMGAYGLKPLDLLQLMGVVRGIHQQAVQFDTTTMACPFEVKFQYRQPYMANWVGELGGRDPARQPLLTWLAAQHLEMPRRSLDSVFADETVVSVPCARIKLKPKEIS